MEKMKQKLEKTRLLFNHRIDSCKLKPGDHIYAYRVFDSYSHHGIYADEERVIHFIQTEANGLIPEQKICEKCGYQKNVHLGVVKSCLDCFLKHDVHDSHSLRLYQYGESSLVTKMKRGGTSSTMQCHPPETVVEKANELHKLENGFGQYDLVKNNCEHFATFCKTGTRWSGQVDKKKPFVKLVHFSSG